MSKRHVPRIYVDFKIGCGEFCLPASKSHHLISVLRIRQGDEILAFDKKCEWQCIVVSVKKHEIIVKTIKKTRENAQKLHKLCLAFGILKPDTSRTLVEKATELGVTDIFPLKTKYSNGILKLSKLEDTIRGSIEQSGRFEPPVIHDELSIECFINNLPNDILWISAIERMSNIKQLANINLKSSSVGFIIGPEGGFSAGEIDLLLSKTEPVSLSNNILRAETAGIACMSCWAASNVLDVL